MSRVGMPHEGSRPAPFDEFGSLVIGWGTWGPHFLSTSSHELESKWGDCRITELLTPHADFPFLH